jgi:tryptophanyl-tRNA synthetase
MKKIALTGIKPTGILHLGNYFGCIKPALKLAETYDARYFIADYHALNMMKDADRLKECIINVSAGWLAAGLDPEKTLIYRQSDIPEDFELTTIIMAFTSKGLMNRAHAYKAAVEKNQAAGNDRDAGVNMGLYTYPVLMAADILLFDTDVVPVGQDQTQHVEMCADIAGSFNSTYGKDVFVIPKAYVQPGVEVIPGLDGRKMSKSYGNTIPLFCDEKTLKKLIMRMVTNSQGVDEPKNPDESSIYGLYKLFATPEETKALAERYRAGGMGWGEAKSALFEVANRELTPLRERYNELVAHPDRIRDILAAGAAKARVIAKETLERARDAIGMNVFGKV